MNFLELDGLKNDPRILQCSNSKSLNKRVVASDTPLMVDEKLKDAKLKNLRKLRVLYAKQIADIENN